MRASFTFLLSGETYETDLPEDTDSRASTNAGFLFGDLPRGLIYEPENQRGDPAKDRGLVPLLEGVVNGTHVAAYRTRERPTTVAAFWRVPGGYMHTYMDDLVSLPSGCNEADRLALLKTVIRSISVSPARSGPFVALAAPLRPGDPRDQLMRESATFARGVGTDAPSAVMFRREPGWAREGKAVERSGTVAEVRITTPAQVSVLATGPTAAVERLEHEVATAAGALAPL